MFSYVAPTSYHMYPYTDATYHDPQFSYVMDSSFPNFTDSLKTAWNFTKKGVKGLHDGFIQKVLQRGASQLRATKALIKKSFIIIYLFREI